MNLLNRIKNSNYIYYAFGVLTILLGIAVSSFNVRDAFLHPQFAPTEAFKEIQTIIFSNSSQSYSIYFIIDFFWAAFFLMVLFKISKLNKTVSILVFSICAITAYSLDIIENGIYLGQIKVDFLTSNFDDLIRAKEIFYLICILFAVRRLLQHYKDFLSALIQVIKSAWISIFIILILIILISQVGQGGTILVDLLGRPFNILFTIILFNFLAIIASHYPIYFQQWSVRAVSKYSWCMDTQGRFLGLGNIFYIPGPEKISPREDKIRRSLGILVFVAWIYASFSVYNNYKSGLSSGLITLFFFLIMVWYYIKGLDIKKAAKEAFKALKENDKSILIDSNNSSISKNKHKELSDAIKLSAKWTGRIFPLIAALILCTIICMWSAHEHQWSQLTFLLFTLTGFISALIFIHFRVSRSMFVRYYGISSKYDFSHRLQDYQYITPLYTKKIKAIKKLLGNLSNNRAYIKLLRFAGTLLFLFILVINICHLSFPDQHYFNNINSIPIFLTYLIFYYSIITIGIKHWMYYRKRQHANACHDALPNSNQPQYFNKYQPFYNRWFPALLIGLVCIGTIGIQKGNDLHELKVVSSLNPDKSIGDLSLQEYITNFKEKVNLKDTTETIYTVNAYGGGLKSNLWTLLVLEELRQSGILNKTISMSGVSGGAIGLANYVSILNNQDVSNISACIDQIGLSNSLTHEINDIFVADSYRELWPFSHVPGRDRSYKSMKIYADITGMNEEQFNDQSYRQIWRSTYIQHNIPVLLLNSASITDQYGIASSVQMPQPFPGAIDLLTIPENKSLTFYDAASTTNRFPFLSPAARVPGKGHFIDGGYFENSGLLSNLSFLNMVIASDTIFNNLSFNIKHIIISNSKTDYIRQFLNNLSLNNPGCNFLSLHAESTSGEIGAIIKALVDTDKLPRQIIEATPGTIIIPLPHKLSYADVSEYLKGVPICIDELTKSIKDQNDKLYKVLNSDNSIYNYPKWGIVQPPLSRLLSKPAVQYQKIMIKNHPEVRDVMEQL